MILHKFRKRLALHLRDQKLMQHNYGTLVPIFQNETHSALQLQADTETRLLKIYDQLTLGSDVLEKKASTALLPHPIGETKLTVASENLLNITVLGISATAKSAMPPVSLYQPNDDIYRGVQTLYPPLFET